MSGDDIPRRPPRATCEDVDEDDFEDGGEDNRRSANVAAKRSKPELHSKASYERRRNNGTDSGYASQAGTVGSGSPNRREKKMADLKIDTSFRERERQPYHYIATKTETRPPPSRPPPPPPDPTTSKFAETKRYYKHPERECWICDKYGKHIDPPKANPVPASPTTARRPPITEEYVIGQTSQVQPRMRRTSSNREAKTVRMYTNMPAGVLYENKPLPSTFTHESPSYQTPAWPTPTTPLTVPYVSLAPVTYTPYSISTAPHVITPVETQRSYFPTLPPPKARPAEPNRRASMHDQIERPVVQQGKSTSARSRDEKDRSYDHHTPLHSRRSSQERDQDRRAMPPPPPPPPPPQAEQVILARRPSIKKAATSTSAPASHRHSQSYDIDRDEFRRLQVIREKRAEASHPPNSYRGPAAANPERPPNRKSVSYGQSKHDIEVVARSSSASDPATRRPTEPSIERYEAEAEAYQRRRGSSDARDLRSHHLTAEALRKVPKAQALDTRSETNSSQKSRNSSSKGSSGAKTGQSNSEIMMRINGIAVGIPADSAQRITIQSKGVNISVGGKGRSGDKEYPSSRNGRAPSVASRTSKTSSSREKEKRMEIDDGRRVARENEVQTLNRAGRTSHSLSRYSSRKEEEAIGYGA